MMQSSGCGAQGGAPSLNQINIHSQAADDEQSSSSSDSCGGSGGGIMAMGVMQTKTKCSDAIVGGGSTI